MKAKLKKLNEEKFLECEDLKSLHISIDSALNQSDINDILKYKKGAETSMKGKAPYTGEPRSMSYRKMLPTSKQNANTSLKYLAPEKTDGDLKRKRGGLEGDQMVGESIAPATSQTTALNDHLTAELLAGIQGLVR